MPANEGTSSPDKGTSRTLEDLVSRTLSGREHHYAVPPCKLSSDDLRDLSRLLEGFAEEAAKRQGETFQYLEGQSEEQSHDARQQLEQLLSLSVEISSNNGDWQAGPPPTLLQDVNLPDVVDQVRFDSAFNYRAALNQIPQESVQLTLNFRRPSILDLDNPSYAQHSHASWGVFRGSDPTWIRGVVSKLNEFFGERRTRWALLHQKHSYDVLLVIIALPVSLFWIARADSLLKYIGNPLSPPVEVGLYVYVTLISLYIFRILYNYSKRLFPRIEGPRKGTRGPRYDRAILFTLVAAWLSDLAVRAVQFLFQRN